ncbi:MAG TPA: hypothetical protein VJ436_11830, partial [Anaerolineales bacterium]|nr:hypothetical protein [Anaerolineales bacterium]
MRRRPARTLLGVGIAISVLILLALIAYTHPGVNSRLAWRIDVARTYLRGVFNPAGKLPTALPEPAFAVTLQPSATPAQVASPTVSPSPTKG